MGRERERERARGAERCREREALQRGAESDCEPAMNSSAYYLHARTSAQNYVTSKAYRVGPGVSGQGYRPGPGSAPRQNFDPCYTARLRSKPFNSEVGVGFVSSNVMAPPITRPGKPRGSASWRKWLPEHISRAAFAAPTASSRAVTGMLGGGAHQTVTTCRRFVAQLVAQAQLVGVKRLCTDDGPNAPYKYYIMSCLFDEAQLRLGRGGASALLASHNVVTFKHQHGTADLDIVRPPVVLGRANAAAMWPALVAKSEICAFALRQHPSADAVKYIATLTTSDAGSPSQLLLRHLCTQLPAHHILFSTFCTQHRTASAITSITRYCRLHSKGIQTARVFRRFALEGAACDGRRTHVVELMVKSSQSMRLS